MFSAKIKTVDHRYGVYFEGRDIDDVLVDCYTWQLQNNFMPAQMEPSVIISLDTGVVVGTLEFDEIGLKMTPCN